jgi:hypothetical protein
MGFGLRRLGLLVEILNYFHVVSWLDLITIFTASHLSVYLSSQCGKVVCILLRKFVLSVVFLMWKYPNLVSNANVDNDATEIYISLILAVMT